MLIGDTMKKYYQRIVENEIELALKSMGAVILEGPKWCGKTTIALRYSKSTVKMQDSSEMANNILIAQTLPSLLLEGKKPRLVDEWQMATNLWDAVRVNVDNTGETGQYILTGSTSPIRSATMHTGTGRFSRIKMYPLSLFESNDSSGLVSLSNLFDGKTMEAVVSDKTIKDFAFLICRGGWPQNLFLSSEQSINTMKQYVKSIYSNDINEVDDTRTDSRRVKSFLKSYSRNIQTMTSNKKIQDDMKSNGIGITRPTFNTYMEKLQRLFIIEEIPAWTPNIRSRSAIRTSSKRGLVDPSIATAVLNINPDMLLKDLELFGLLFESLCIRDLRVYANKLGGRISHYHDQEGLECDAVVVLPNGDYGLIEIKLGGVQEDVAAKNLLKLESLLFEKKRPPIFKMILTGGQYGYERPDEVLVVPISILRD